MLLYSLVPHGGGKDQMCCICTFLQVSVVMPVFFFSSAITYLQYAKEYYSCQKNMN